MNNYNVTYSELYNYAYDVLTNIVDEFVDKCEVKFTADQFLNLVIGFENYLKNAHSDELSHCAVNSALHEICRNRECLSLWDIYSCEVTK